jgi:hypothetical protein
MPVPHLRPALRGPHAAARCSVRRRLQGRRRAAFCSASDAAGAVRRGGLRLLRCRCHACARRCEGRTLRHAVAYVAPCEASTAFGARPALQAPHAVSAARCSGRRPLRRGHCARQRTPGAASAARHGERRPLRRKHCTRPCAPGAANTARRRMLRRASPSAARALRSTVRAQRCENRRPGGRAPQVHQLQRTSACLRKV